MEEFTFDIFNLLTILVAAWIGGSIARKVGYPAILGELIIGIILGPALLGVLDISFTVKVLSEVGIILLMVYIGIEINFKDLQKVSWPGLLASTGAFVVPFALGYTIVTLFNGSNYAALFVGIAVGVTSLATKSRILVDLQLLNTRIAYVLMAGALISDTLALLIFAGILSVAKSGTIEFGHMVMVTAKALAFFAITISIGVYVLPRLGTFLARFKYINSTFYFTIILIISFGYSEMAELAGLHSILGAFMAGLFIKDNLFPKSISKEVHKTFYDVSVGFMAPIFFVTAGFAVDVHVFQTNLPLLLLIIVFAMTGKLVGTALFYLPSGHGWREGLTVGAGMIGSGAVEIIIAGIGLEMGMIDRNIYSILVFMAIITTITVPVTLKATTNWLKKRGELVLMNHRIGYLIAGVNPISLFIAKKLSVFSPVCMIDTNYDAVETAHQNGFKCIHGNALKEDTLNEAGATTMETFIGITSNTEINILAAQVARETFFVPKSLVVLTRKKDGAGSELLDTIKATSLFAMGIDIEYWFEKIRNNEFAEKSETIVKAIRARIWLKNLKDEKDNILPILIMGSNKICRPFHFGEKLSEGEKVIFLV